MLLSGYSLDPPYTRPVATSLDVKKCSTESEARLARYQRLLWNCDSCVERSRYRVSLVRSVGRNVMSPLATSPVNEVRLSLSGCRLSMPTRSVEDRREVMSPRTPT